jgi:hypothetical protein
VADHRRLGRRPDRLGVERVVGGRQRRIVAGQRQFMQAPISRSGVAASNCA